MYACLTMTKATSEYIKAIINEYIANREQKLLELENAIKVGRFAKIKSIIEELDKYTSLAETALKLKKYFEEKQPNE